MKGYRKPQWVKAGEHGWIDIKKTAFVDIEEGQFGDEYTETDVNRILRHQFSNKYLLAYACQVIRCREIDRKEAVLQPFPEW